MSGWVFGKLPAHGDFVARGMRAETRAALDDWLSAGMVAARALYGEDFERRFDTAQPWRAVGDGVAGALAASQDAAGRRFPLLLLGKAGADCEDLLYAAITEGWSVDRLAGAIDAPDAPVSRWYREGAELVGERPADILPAMLA